MYWYDLICYLVITSVVVWYLGKSFTDGIESYEERKKNESLDSEEMK